MLPDRCFGDPDGGRQLGEGDIGVFAQFLEPTREVLVDGPLHGSLGTC
jgi:hypothetical protein